LSSDEPLTFRHYLQILARRKWLVLPVVILVPLVVLAITASRSAAYKASADVLLNRENIAANLSGVPDTTSLQDPERFGQTQAELARVPTIASRVVKATGVDQSAGGFLGSSSVTPHPNADLLTFSVTSGTTALAEQLATEYGRQFTIYRAELDNGFLLQSRSDAQARLAQLRKRGQLGTPLGTSLQDRVAKINTLLALQAPTATLVAPATSAVQVAPRPTRNALLALAVAIVLGVALAFFAEAMDTRVSDEEEIAEGVGLPVLARIPPALSGKSEPALLVDPEGPEAEAFRMLRTKLEFANLDRQARSIMVTSAIDAEGKTTTAANLALVLAQAGNRVILCDLDAHNPQLAALLGVRETPGIVDVALHHATLQDAVVPVASGKSAVALVSTNGGSANASRSLQVLPFGTFVPDGGDVLRAKPVAELLASLRERADYVIVDAPPLLQVADALTLSTRVDALLLVARVSTVRRPMLREVHRMLEASTTTKLGLVLTGARPAAGSYGGYGRSAQAAAERLGSAWARSGRRRERVPAADEHA
jgi:polysaccharide biosynthesis transport protein